MNQNPTKIVGYCRVSTVEQADNGHSIDAQRAAITAAAETRGREILWVEDAASAKDLDRPGAWLRAEHARLVPGRRHRRLPAGST